MLTKTKLLATFKRGDLETVSRELDLYGSLVSRADWHTDTGYYKGWTRVKSISHFGINWETEMLNGEVRRVKHDYVKPRKV